ncbi:MAG: FAD-dependent oxidoreductase [Rickettsiales bacterium]|nr:FAD-dependent oxidoreductase [Rickettsiales bacterium]
MLNIGLHESRYAREFSQMLGLSTSKFKPRRVHVVGAGLSGLACAVRLQSKGVPVTLYEASNQAGGRCRSYDDKKLGRILDNGNHLILRGNRAAWNYIKQLSTFHEFYGVTQDYIFHDAANRKQWYVRPPFVHDAWQGLHLLAASKDKTVAQCFNTQSQFYREFVEPLCIAALNTHPKYASAQILRNVWLRMLMPGNADYLQIYSDFNRALIEPALRQIDKVELMQRLRMIEIENGRVSALQFTEFRKTIAADARVVLALPPEATAALIPSLNIPPLETNSIINGHFLYDTDKLAPRLLGTVNSPLHWVFLKDGIISTTTSHAETSAFYNKENIAHLLWQEVGKCYSALKDKPMPPHRIVTEKRATIAATPKNLAQRPKAESGLANLTLAGDWLDSPLPACIENAITSGNRAARWCLKQKAQ